MRGHELTTRGQLLREQADHPRAKDEYYKIQLGPLEKLAQPVRSEKWRRITFLYTTGEYLLKAQSVNDLVVHSEERQVLWKALRERMAFEEEYQTKQDKDETLDDEILAALLGIDGIREQL